MFIRASLTDIRKANDDITSKGVHHPNWWRSTMFITNKEEYEKMPFELAHEMYHEYQYRNRRKEFKDGLTLEECEIQASGFALAYCEILGKLTSADNPDKYLPAEISHKEFSEETKRKTAERKYPLAVVKHADVCAEKFSMETFIREEEYIE